MMDTSDAASTMTKHPGTHPEILATLASNATVVAGYFGGLPADVAFTGDSDLWSPAHHLVHLTKVCGAIARALRSNALPAHSTGRSSDYGGVRDRAAVALGAAPRDRLLRMGRTVELPAGADLRALVNAYALAAGELRAAASQWTEEALDRHAIPHPLMGELTVREMLLFVIVHERHHLRGVGYHKGISAT